MKPVPLFKFIYYKGKSLLCYKLEIYVWLWIQELIADFEVSEGIYSRASIEETDSVCLWLGANVMLEYSLEEVFINNFRLL